MTNYRIVCDPFSMYHVQFRTRYWPFWRDAYGNNSCEHLDKARELAHRHSLGLARNEGRAPAAARARMIRTAAHAALQGLASSGVTTRSRLSAVHSGRASFQRLSTRSPARSMAKFAGSRQMRP